MDNYICKIATISEMNTKWDYEIKTNVEDLDNWIKKKHIQMEQWLM